MPDSGAADRLSGVRAGYDRWALVYDHDLNPLPALEEPHAERYVGWPMLLVLALRAAPTPAP